MKVNEGLVEIACDAYYTDGTGLVNWSETTSQTQIRMRLGMEGMLEKVIPLVSRGVPVHSHEVMLEALDGAFSYWVGRPNGWAEWVAHYGSEQFDVYAPAVTKALTAVFGSD